MSLVAWVQGLGEFGKFQYDDLLSVIGLVKFVGLVSLVNFLDLVNLMVCSEKWV